MDTVEVRDLRKNEWCQIEHEFIDLYARQVGIAATCVYMSLCRHANKEQQCWPSIKLIAAEHRISTRTVIRAIQCLEKLSVVQVERRKTEDTSRQMVNTYSLLDKSNWAKKPGDTRETGYQKPGDKNDTKPGDTRNTEVTTGTKNKLQVQGPIDHRPLAEPGNDEVQKLMGVFYRGNNPSLNYGNRSYRKAAEVLVKKFGLEKTLRAAKYAVSVSAERYAPTITNPLQLQEKLAALIKFQQTHAPRVLNLDQVK